MLMLAAESPCLFPVAAPTRQRFSAGMAQISSMKGAQEGVENSLIDQYKPTSWYRSMLYERIGDLLLIQQTRGLHFPREHLGWGGSVLWRSHEIDISA
jgi:hypothetical protein